MKLHVRRALAGVVLAGLWVGTPPSRAEQETNDADPTADRRPPTYQLGPGDVVEVTVYGEPDLSRLVTVQHGGEVAFPLLGDVVVAGLTVEDVEQRLEELLGKDFLVSPQVSVKVKEYRSQWVTLVGEAARPGRYYLNGPTTLLDLLTEAGGFTAQASGGVVVSRLDRTFDDGTTTRIVELSQDMSPEEQKNALSLVLASGDVVTVSAQSHIYVSGEVKNAGSYPLTAGLTVLKAVSLAGGIGKFGSKGKVEILRKDGTGKQEIIKVDLGSIEEGKVADIPLAPGDIVKVGKRVF